MNTHINGQVTCIAFDGGPCSGKSTGMVKIAEALVRVGIIPVIVPESATLLIKSGITPSDLGILGFQKSLADLQINNERIYMVATKALGKKYHKRSVLLCDRSLVGAAAYLPGRKPLEKLNEILAAFGTNVEEIRTHYTGIIHMVTAANGAEQFYTLENNEARTETIDEARELDNRTVQVLLGHPHLAVVGNRDKKDRKISFKKKMSKVVAEVFRILGVPMPIEIEDRYKLENFDPKRLPVPYEDISIKQTYLVPREKGTTERVRMRSWGDFVSYSHTIKSKLSKNGRIERESLVSEKEYLTFLKRSDPSKQPIRKIRYCFVWKDQYFEVDVFKGKLAGLIILERERTEKNDKTEIPPFIKVKRDVTEDKSFSNSALASRA